MVVPDRKSGIYPVVELSAPDTAADTETAVVIDRTLGLPERCGDVRILPGQRAETVVVHTAVHLEKGTKSVRSEVQVQPDERNDVILRFDGLDLVVVIVGARFETHYPALDTVTQGGMDQLLIIKADRFLSGQPRIAELRRKPVAAESAGDLRMGLQRGLTRLVVIIRPLGVVEKQPAANRDFEIHTAQVLKIIAETHRDIRIAVIGHCAGGHVRRDVRRDIHPVTVVHTVFIREVALQNVFAEILAGRGADAVEHPRRVVSDAEVVFDLRIAALVVHVPHDITRTGVLARSVEIQHRIERIARPGLQVERQRTVEFPIGHRRRTDRPRGECRLQRQRRDRIVDFGPHLHRVGHIGHDGQLRGAFDARNIGFGHFDPFFHLRAHAAGKRRQQRGGKQYAFHHQFSFAIRSFASATMPSSAGE